MITITVDAFSMFDERTEQFISVNQTTKLRMENSLHAIAEWEKKYKKQWLPDNTNKNPYVKKKDESRTPEEMLYFIKCMIFKVNDQPVIDIDDIDDKLLYGLSEENSNKITAYLQDSQTALKSIPETKEEKKNRAEVKMTSERVYAWLAEQQIPWEAEYWNINRLFNLIQIINYDNTPDDKKKRAKPYEVAQDYAALNQQRLEKLGKKG
jgi:hypothetical protein